MTSPPSKDRSHESIVNDVLARVLRERVGLSAAAETLHGGLRPDIIVRLTDSIVILEVEIDPAPTVEADALARLGMEIDGQEVQNVFAVRVPAQLRSTSQSRLFERMAGAHLEWQEWRSDGSSGPRLRGSAIELGNAVASVTPPAADLDEAVDVLDKGVRRAGALLYQITRDFGPRFKEFSGPSPGMSRPTCRPSSSSTPWCFRTGWPAGT